MFARVGTYQSKPEDIDKVTSSFQGRTDTVQNLQGFRDAYLLVDRKSGKAVTVTLWESEQALADSAEAAGKLRSAAADEFGGTILSVETYEVALHTKGGGA